MEDEAAAQLLGMLPEELRASYEPLLREEDKEIKRIVKAADKLSAYIKCVEELRAGNNEFRDAGRETLESLKDMGMPEVDWFLQRFGSSFGLTLDELRRR